MNCLRALAALLLALTASNASAALITFDATNLGGATWRYDYSITNDSQAGGIDYFTLTFDRLTYGNLRDAVGPDGWDILLLQPDPELPADGVFDALALDAGIAFGTTLGGFSVTFDLLGALLPGTQPFTILNSGTFEPVEEGTANAPVSVTEPSTTALFAGALVLVMVAARRRSRKPERATATTVPER